MTGEINFTAAPYIIKLPKFISFSPLKTKKVKQTRRLSVSKKLSVLEYRNYGRRKTMESSSSMNL